jgi:hypothetical protein
MVVVDLALYLVSCHRHMVSTLRVTTTTMNYHKVARTSFKVRFIFLGLSR